MVTGNKEKLWSRSIKKQQKQYSAINIYPVTNNATYLIAILSEYLKKSVNSEFKTLSIILKGVQKNSETIPIQLIS